MMNPRHVRDVLIAGKVVYWKGKLVGWDVDCLVPPDRAVARPRAREDQRRGEDRRHSPGQQQREQSVPAESPRQLLPQGAEHESPGLRVEAVAAQRVPRATASCRRSSPRRSCCPCPCTRRVAGTDRAAATTRVAINTPSKRLRICSLFQTNSARVSSSSAGGAYVNSSGTLPRRRLIVTGTPIGPPPGYDPRNPDRLRRAPAPSRPPSSR